MLIAAGEPSSVFDNLAYHWRMKTAIKQTPKDPALINKTFKWGRRDGEVQVTYLSEVFRYEPTST